MQPDAPPELSRPARVVSAFAGPGVLGAGHVLAVFEALERRGVRYHKKIPALTEVARVMEVLDHDPWVGEGTVSSRHLRLQWEEFHREDPLDTEGLSGLRQRLTEIPAGARGLRTSLGYAFPGREPERVEPAFHLLDGGRYEVRFSASADRVLGAGSPKRTRANALMLADLAEAVYDTLGAPYGAVRIDAGVLPDQLPTQGWGFYSAALVERAGRAGVEELAGRCYKSWELADGGWFVAPAPLDGDPGHLAAARAGLFGSLRHLPLERMGPALGTGARP